MSNHSTHSPDGKRQEMGDRSPDETMGNESIGDSVLVFGYVEWVNGPKARLVPDFVPTRHELGVLAQHYLDNTLAIRHFQAWSATYGGMERREIDFASRRLDRIEALLGSAEFSEATAEVVEKWKPKFAEVEEDKKKHTETCDCGRTAGLCPRRSPNTE